MPNHLSGRRRRRAFGLTAVAVSCAALTLVRPAGADTDGMRLVAVDQSTLPQVRLVAVVPPMLSETSLESGAFTVRQGGQDLPATVDRLADKGLQVVLAADRGVSNAALSQELAAATELAHLMPDTVQVSGLDPVSGGVTDLPRTATLASLSTTRTDPQSSVAGTLATAAVSEPKSARRAFVLFTTCPGKEVSADNSQLAASLSLHDQQLDVIQIGRRCGHGLPDVARQSGGAASMAETPAMIAASADRVERELLGEYRVTFRLQNADGAPATVAVSAYDVHANASLPLRSTPDDSHELSLWLLLGGGGVVIVVLLAGAGFVLWRSRQGASVA